MHFSCQALVLAVLALEGAIAHPAHGHAHVHKHKRDLADVLNKRVNFNDEALYKGINWKDSLKGVNWDAVFHKGGSSSAPATSSPSAKPKPKANSPPAEEKIAVQPSAASSEASEPSTPPKTSQKQTTTSSGGKGECVDINDVWTKGDTSKTGDTAADVGLKGAWTDASTTSASKTKRAAPWQDAHIGNIGNPYGSNIVPLSDCNNKDHKYSIRFTNGYKDGRQMSLALWNKVGSDKNPLSGPFLNSYFFIDLPPGKSAAFAFEPDSQIAFSEASDECPRQQGSPGGWYCIWGEANFQPTGDGGESSWDVSVMVDPAGVKGQLTITDGTEMGTSSRSRCGYENASQEYAGAGKVVCDPNTWGPAKLQATFGLDSA